MRLDPITALHRDHPVATPGSYGEHHVLDVARHVADARSQRSGLRWLRLPRRCGMRMAVAATPSPLLVAPADPVAPA